jgi:hypothetical protein
MPRSDEQRSPHLLALARRHPGWGCRRIWAAMLERHGVTASKSAIANWVRDAGLARPRQPKATAGRLAATGSGRRHVRASGFPAAGKRAGQAGALLPMRLGRRPPRRSPRPRLRCPRPRALASAASAAGHGADSPRVGARFVDREALAVARDLLDPIRYGTNTPVLARVELRRLGWTDEEIDKTLGPSSRSRSRSR